MPSNIFVSCTVWPQEKISWGISFLRNTEILNNGFRYLYFLPMECAVFTAKKHVYIQNLFFWGMAHKQKMKKGFQLRPFHCHVEKRLLWNGCSKEDVILCGHLKKSWENLQRTSPFNVERLSSLSLQSGRIFELFMQSVVSDLRLLSRCTFPENKQENFLSKKGTVNYDKIPQL